ncbi:PaaI family thioesterase [Nocardioides sp. R-C-SC26]|uniref:PaaI family thioesterase n=1 Tax=Nocardioides sp. R-C-SC26 TaxID=2870414 RepID=UPI001E2A4611|nr:PaaI family thioesterase [Nocardioides sp. R-C-SC26]
MNETQEAFDVSTATGLELLRAMIEGRIPPAPISETIGMVDFIAEEGSVSVSLDPAPRHYNPIGSVHGGVISTLLDTVAACSVHSTLAAGEGYTSLDLTVKFLRPVTVASGRLTATGRVIHRGRRTALAEGEILDAAGKRVAHATSSCMIFPAG